MPTADRLFAHIVQAGSAGLSSGRGRQLFGKSNFFFDARDWLVRQSLITVTVEPPNFRKALHSTCPPGVDLAYWIANGRSYREDMLSVEVAS